MIIHEQVPAGPVECKFVRATGEPGKPVNATLETYDEVATAYDIETGAELESKTFETKGCQTTLGALIDPKTGELYEDELKRRVGPEDFAVTDHARTMAGLEPTGKR